MDLLAAKSLSIGKLMVLAPPGTIDPTPHLYDTTMYALSGLMAVAFVAQGLVRPLPPVPTGAATGTIIDVPAPEAPVSAKVQELSDAQVGDRQVNK